MLKKEGKWERKTEKKSDYRRMNMRRRRNRSGGGGEGGIMG